MHRQQKLLHKTHFSYESSSAFSFEQMASQQDLSVKKHKQPRCKDHFNEKKKLQLIRFNRARFHWFKVQYAFFTGCLSYATAITFLQKAVKEQAPVANIFVLWYHLFLMHCQKCGCSKLTWIHLPTSLCIYYEHLGKSILVSFATSKIYH